MRKEALGALAALLLGFVAMHPATAHGTYDAGVVAKQAAKLVADDLAGQRFVVIGEMHGTAETPAIAGEVLARWAESEPAQPLLLGLEVTSVDQPRLDRFLASKGTTADRAALLAGAHWTEPMHDGRDSLAMAALLERVRSLRAAGAHVDVVLFDAPGDGDRDARMAKALRTAIAAHPHARVLVLTGNVHAMTGEPPEMIRDGKPYKLPTPLARRLSDLHPVSIDVRAMQGDFWACQGTCGVHALPPAPRNVAAPSLSRSDAGDAWDYRIVLPRFTASRPAAP